MKKTVCLLLALVMVLSLAACGGSSAPAPAESKPAEAAPAEAAPAEAAPAEETKTEDAAPAEAPADYTIRIYSNSNSSERVTWLVEEAKKAGFTISLDTNEVYSGDDKAVQAANEKKDGDIIFGLNETRWGQLVNNEYENLRIMEWTPSWADEVGGVIKGGRAYGIVNQNVLMLYRTDELGTNGKELHFDHWADVVDSGYTWYRQNKVGGTTNANINAAILYPFVDPDSPAGGISIDGWKTLWKFCAEGKFGGDDWKYGIDPLNRGDVAISEYYSSSLYGSIDTAADSSDHPLVGTVEPENWSLMDIADGTYYIAEYLGILERPGRTEEETEIVKAFAEWFGSAEVQAAWAEEFDSFPCNTESVKMVYGDAIPPIYQIKNFAVETVEGTDMSYADYVYAHNSQWTNILTNLGFYWKDANDAPAEPDWANLDWATLTQKKDA